MVVEVELQRRIEAKSEIDTYDTGRRKVFEMLRQLGLDPKERLNWSLEIHEQVR